MNSPTVRVPEGSDLRSDATLNYLKLAVAKALRGQLDSTSDWRDIAMITDSDTAMKSVINDETYLEIVIAKLEWRDDDYDAAIREFVPHLLGIESARAPGGDLVVTPTKLPALEDRLNLAAWLASNDPGLYRRLYLKEQDSAPAGPSTMTLDNILSVMDTASANLERLQAVWDRAYPMLPTGPQGGSTNEYDDLMRSWNDLLKGLPLIEGWTITDPLPDMNDIGMMYVDYLDIGEPPLGVFDAKERPEKELAEYRYRLSRARRTVIRDRLQELAARVDNLLPQVVHGVENDSAYVVDDRIPQIVEAIAEIERLMGGAAQRRGRWSDLHRHIRFGQGGDWHDILNLDWPSTREDVEAAWFSGEDALPVPAGIDLGQLADSRPEGRASTELNWQVLDPGRFESLLHDLLRALPGYQNVQLLMKTNAADRGRDLSAERAFSDGAGGVRTERVIVQAKHWLSKSVPPEEISSTVTRIGLWEPPVVRSLIVATSGHFTPDAVAWVDKHNDLGQRPYIDLWSNARLGTLLSERPYLVAEYGLR